MKTDDLIAVLATGIEPLDHRRLRRRLLWLPVAGALAAFLLCIVALKVNPHLGLETGRPAFWVRESFCLTIAVTALIAVRRLGSPGNRLGALPLIVIAAVAAVWVLALMSVVAAPPSSRVALIMGHTARWCPFLITSLAAAPLAAFMASLRALAPTRPGWAGAAAGLAAGGCGAVAYTLHCPELEPAFIGVWYLLGMVIPTAVGAWLGPRLLQW